MKFKARSGMEVLAAFAACACSIGQAAPIEYVITFKQTFLAHDPSTTGYEWLGPRVITGQLTVDDSVLTPNTKYGPSVAGIYSYTLSLDSKGYSFDLASSITTSAPPFSTIIETDATGTIIDLQGAFRYQGTLSVINLGRDGYEKTYVDFQQTDPFGNAFVSGGTYSITLASSVPEPLVSSLYISGLISLGLFVGNRRTAMRSRGYKFDLLSRSAINRQ
jgi:hypothetical protein